MLLKWQAKIVIVNINTRKKHLYTDAEKRQYWTDVLYAKGSIFLN